MKRILALLMALCLVLSGCTVLQENNNMDDLPKLTHKAQLEEKENIIKPALYFQDSQTGRLTAEVREISVEQERDSTEAVLEALLQGPESSNLQPLGQDLSLSDVEVTDEIANVYLESSSAMAEEAQFSMSLSVADTVIDFTGVKYVSVFLNGDVLSIGGAPCGPLRKSDGNVETIYREYLAKYSALYTQDESSEIEMDVVFYYLDPTGSYLRPEVREVTFENGNYVEKLLEELSLGPEYKYYLQSYLSREEIQTGSVQVQFNAQKQQYYLKADNSIFLDDTGASDNLRIAGLYYTIAGLLPNSYRVVLEAGGDIWSATRRVSAPYLGETITLCLPDVDLTSLATVSRTVEESSSGALSTYIRELIKGPLESDADNIWPAFPENISIDDLLGTHYYGSVVVVDFSKNFQEQVSLMQPKRQTLLIYSIVNTLTNISGVNSVQFLIEGEVVSNLGGEVSLYTPLFPNPGIQK